MDDGRFRRKADIVRRWGEMARSRMTQSGQGCLDRHSQRPAINSIRPPGVGQSIWPKSALNGRLTAILAGDVAGYSRLMGADEEGTLKRLNAHRREFLEPKIKEHRGRIVKRSGDGVLIEFASAVDAGRCAVEIQRGMSERNRPAPPDKRIELRIGIHVGDVIIEEGDIFGDGVNIAARLEAIAVPGGICISDDAYRQVRDKLNMSSKTLASSSSKTSRGRCASIASNLARAARHSQPRQHWHCLTRHRSRHCRFRT